MSLFRDSKSIRLFDKDSYVFHDGRTASQIMDKAEQPYGNESTSNIKISNLQKSGAINKNNGNFDVRNPVMANFASPSTFGSFGSGAGSGLLYTSPQFYSPIHTATNWQIPTKRREVYQWCRFFSQNDPTIASSLRFYSRFPFNGFELQMSDPVRKEHFEKLCKRLKVKHWLPLMAFDYFSMGDCFAFVSIQTPNSGSGFHNGADPIDYTNAKITGISILNPDTVEVIFNPMNPMNNFMNLTIDDNLKKIVWEKKPIQVYQSLPEWLKFYVQKNLPIPLHPDNITHLKHDERAVAPYGVSILVPLFPTLAYQDKLRQAQWIVAERHILPIKICKIGNDQRPAGPQDIADTQSQLGATANDPNLTLVVHHAFDFQWVGAAGKVLQLTKEYELIEKALIKGLGVNEALLSGTGPSYSQAAIGIEATIDRLEGVRNIFSEWLEEKVFKIEALIQGFYKTDLSGNKVLDYPTVKWKDLSLRDETQKKNQMLQLWDKKIVSTQYVCEEFGIDYDIETERIRLETEYQQQLGIMPDDGGGGGGGKGGLGGGLGGGFGGGGGGGKGGLGGDPMKGNLPGGQSGPGLPGDSNAPSMSGGDVEASHDFRLRAHEDALKTKPKVYRPGKYDLKKPKPPVIQKQKEEMEQGIVLDGRTGQFRLTSIEASLYKSVKSGIEQGNLPPDFIIQQKPEPVEMSRVIVDGFWPSLKLIIEADGKMWHDNPDKINTDTERDDRFRALGWTVLRFTEDEIEHQIENVLAKIIDSARGIIEYKQPKTASTIKEIVEASEEIEIEQVYEESFLTGEWFEIE